MGYSDRLRRLFEGITLRVEDLLLLETFQVNYLPERVPQKEFATLIRNHSFVKSFLILKDPSMESFIESVLEENKKIEDKDLIKEYCDELLWEIADQIIYNKFPEIYDQKVKFRWNIKEIVARGSLINKIVADVGAGSGMLTFLLAKYAKNVYAIEPISSFRKFIRAKADKEKCGNIYTIDGFLDSIPLPDNTIDLLFTSNAIGWNLEYELPEIERVIKPGGKAIHLLRADENEVENPFHKILTSSDWKYDLNEYSDTSGIKLKYHKTIL